MAAAAAVADDDDDDDTHTLHRRDSTSRSRTSPSKNNCGLRGV